MRIANFIIAGTEKAGTTSVFTYLSEHPEVCAASRKETDFFCDHWKTDPNRSLREYAGYFSHCPAEVPIVMEASPGYLGDAELVVPRIAQILKDVRILFILRDPVERIYSSYNFHIGRLDIDANVDFATYINRCKAYARKEQTPEELGMDEWYLRVLEFGCYSRYLRLYLEAFPRHRIKVMFFEQLKTDTATFMTELSRFLEIDSDFWSTYRFRKSNVTFFAGNETLHRMAVMLNEKAEPLLRSNPAAKRFLVSMYKKINQRREGYDAMPIAVENELRQFYRPFNTELSGMIDIDGAIPWIAQSLAESA